MHFVPESTRWLLASAKPERRIEAKAAMKEASIANEIYNQDTDAKIDALIHKDAQSSNTKKSQGFLSIFRCVIKTQLRNISFDIFHRIIELLCQTHNSQNNNC